MAPRGTRTDWKALFRRRERELTQLREAAKHFVPSHSGLCVPVVNGKLDFGGRVTPESCKCNEQAKALRTALGLWW